MASISNAERRWAIGAAALALLVVVVGWFFFISPQREQTAGIESSTADAQTQNLTLQGRISKLQADSKNEAKYVAALEAARRALPAQSSISPLLRDIQRIAAVTTTRVTSFTVGDPTAFALPGASAAPTAPASSAETSAAGGTAAGAPAGGGAGSGIFAIPIDIGVTGSVPQLSNFLARLQSAQPRAVLVTKVSRNTDETGTVLQVTMSAFAAPGAAVQPGS